eukprot:11920846-Ditylum_brightwellii.AAC.1
MSRFEAAINVYFDECHGDRVMCQALCKYYTTIEKIQSSEVRQKTTKDAVIPDERLQPCARQ